MRLSTLACLFAILVMPGLSNGNDAALEKLFETQIRPLLAEHCFECHSEKKQQGEVRLDYKTYVFEGKSTGPLVIPGEVNKSRLWQVLQYDDADVQMPPRGKLSADQLQLIRNWIEQGAYWPKEELPKTVRTQAGIPHKPDGTIDFDKAAREHWAYRSVQQPALPQPEGSDQCQTRVDNFILKRLEKQKLKFSAPASRQTLIRRLSFDLLGIPPTFAEVMEFVNDSRPDAIERLVDRYLASPLYGQRWGRYWLDIARYADTKGYVFTENRFYPYSYTYRDYVIASLNRDTPYDQFIVEQLAADQLGLPEHDPRLAAMGFLTIGPRFLNRTPDIIDDRIDVVTRGLLGMTVSCARCHDHKYDPIPTADYYSLYGVFDSCFEPELPPLAGTIDESAPGYIAYMAELNKRQQALDDYKRTAHADLLQQAVDRAGDYLPAAAQRLGNIPEQTEIPYQHGEPRTAIVNHWKRFLGKKLKANDPVFRHWKRFMEIPVDDLSNIPADLSAQLEQDNDIPTVLKDAFRQTPPKSHLDVAQTYGRVFANVVREWKAYKQNHADATALDDSGAEQIRRQLFGPGSLTDLPAGQTSPLFERDNRSRIRKLEKGIDTWRVTSPDAPPRAMVLFDKEQPVEPVVFLRGNPGARGDRVPRRIPQILDETPAGRFSHGSGRLELARKIASPDNPLTARVIVNRVWMYHLGTPLVSTTSDFGTRGERPTHPELLDDLAWRLMHEFGWSLKKLHREILLSRTYQQSSLNHPDPRKVDPENQLYWRQNRKRLDFEAMRDAHLQVAGLLDNKINGRPVDLEKQPFSHRRTVYGLIDRNNLPGLFRTFDFPSPDSSSPGRPLTTVPQQALFSMNSTFAQAMADAVAQRVTNESSDPQRQVSFLVETVFSRSPTRGETDRLSHYLNTHSLVELTQAMLMTNEFLFVD